MPISDLLGGIVVETKRQSCTGQLFYSDRIYYENVEPGVCRQSALNEAARIPIIGIAAGVARMALALIHSVGHMFAALFTCDKGHLYHAAKGGCEFLRGLIEALPFAGRAFARLYDVSGLWWMIKIYNPTQPDTLDRYSNYWAGLKQNRPAAYVIA